MLIQKLEQELLIKTKIDEEHKVDVEQQISQLSFNFLLKNNKTSKNRTEQELMIRS